MDPIVPLLPYQQKWVADNNRFKIALKARQIGWTWCTMLALVLRCAFGRRQKWHYLSLSEDRAKNSIEYGIQHCDAMDLTVKQHVQTVGGRYKGSIYKSKQMSIEFPNGAKIIALTSNPVTARGCSGNVVLDEFAHHPDAGLIWQSVLPVTTRGYSIEILSTPNGKVGPFYDIYTGADSDWSRHECDIYQAVSDGLSVDIQTLQRKFTEDDWLQEYCCVFLDSAATWLPKDLIKSCMDRKALCTFNYSSEERNLFLGVDMARKRDLCVLWVLARLDNLFITRGVICFHKQKYSTIREEINRIMPRVSMCAIDNGTTGAQICEELQEKWGEDLVVGVPCQLEHVKAKMATTVKDKISERQILLPEDEDVLKDLHAIRRYHTDRGTVSFDAPRTKHGHADRFWALGLALYASASVTKQKMDYKGGGARPAWSRIAKGSAHRLPF
jgi:phage FluMu gp28-like protein